MSLNMSEQDSSKQQPYSTLGSRLKGMRQKLQESTAEVSGAVEIDIDTLQRIEQGKELPSEDILMLLINHFGLCDDEAVDLWEMAGYDQRDIFCDHDQPQQVRDEPRLTKQPVVLLALDSRVVYSNGAEVVADKNGLIMSFTQFVDTSQGPVPVARVGMSYEQAEQVIETLQRAVLRGKYAGSPKRLPMPRASIIKKSRKRQKEE
jgi:DNA-binding XRE family transcriptional regulator